MLKIFSAFVSILFIFNSAAQESHKWILKKEKNGIVIFTASSDSSPIKSLRAIGQVKASLPEILSLLRDVQNSTSWVPNLEKRDYFKKISDTEAILYDLTHMPWPVQDRELLLHHRLLHTEGRKRLLLVFESTHQEKFKTGKGSVLAKVHTGKMYFQPLKNNLTEIELFLHVDPKGEIPIWLINLLQIQMPYDLISAIRKHAPENNSKYLPGIKKMVDELSK